MFGWFWERLERLRQTRRKSSPVKYIIQRVYDEDANAIYFIEIVCTCGWNVAYFRANEDNFWCEHCDRGCEEGLPTCYFCNNLRYEPQIEED